MTTRAALVVVLAVALTATASARPADLDIHQAAVASFEGDLEVVARGGVAHALAPATSAVATVHVLHGRAVVTTQQAILVDDAPQDFKGDLGAPERRVIPLDESDVDVVSVDELFDAVVIPGATGVLHLRGPAQGTGSPVFLVADTTSSVSTGTPESGAPEWTWRAGWLWMGAGGNHVPVASFPQVGAAVLDVRGPAVLDFYGGNATVAGERIRLGSWTEEDASVPGGVVHVLQGLRIEAEVAWASVPLGPRWDLAAPDVAWTVSGVLAWEDASGRADGAPFTDARVVGAGDVVIRPARGGDGASYAVSGNWTRLAVDGRVVVAPTASVVAEPVAVTAGVAAAAFLAWRLFFALYTRIAPEDVLEHPTRRRILELVRAEPGQHVRDLHRGIGGSWTAFRFHLRFLAGAGYVRAERRGRYKLVYPTAVRDKGDVRVPHPVARAVFEAVPPDGRVVALRDVRAAVGISRQLATYHAKRLAAEGLLALVPAPDGRPGVSRRLP